MDVRRLQPGDDFRDLIVLSKAFFEEYQGHHGEFFGIETLHDQDVIAYFSCFLNKDDRVAFIALRDDHVIGYITLLVQSQPSYWKVKRIGHISGLMVGNGNRRQGIGTLLLEQARGYLREQGVKYYTVCTAVQNRQALEFYERRGLEALQSNLVGAGVAMAIQSDRLWVGNQATICTMKGVVVLDSR